ncbi:Ligand-gated ion channel [Popillia japonica]|uniref:Ligand-gated ion channel n=2 Tax=Popillia japonica TaxID=7064 RepID=A0AAW1KN61_POPJA
MLFLTLIKLSTLLTPIDSKTTEVCAKIVLQVIPRKNALCYITDSIYPEEYIRDCLEIVSTPLLMINPETYKNDLNYRRIPIGCDGFLVVSNNYTYLERLFSRPKKDMFEFEAHKRIIIIYHGIGNFSLPPFGDVVQNNGNNLIVIDNFEGSMTRITSVLDNNVSKVWYYENNPNFNIEFPPWMPDLSFRNRTFKVATFNCTPFIYINSDNEVYDGLEFQFIKLLLRDWPLAFDVYNVTQYMNMYLVVMKAVHHGLDEMSTCSIWQRTTLPSDLDYTHSYSETCSSFLVPKPHEIPRVWFVYYPVDISIWILIGFTMVVIGFLLNLLYTLSNANDEYYIYYFLQSFRIIWTGSIEQTPRNPHKILRPILALSFLTSLIISAGYSGGLSSILTSPQLWDIKSMSDMLRYNIRWGNTKAFVQSDVSLSIYPDALELSKRFQLEEDISVKNQRFLTNRYAMSTDRLAENYATDTETFDDFAKMHLKILPQCFMRNALVYVLTPNSPYKNVLNKRVLEIVEHGFLHHWTNNVIIRHNLSYMYRFFENTFDSVGHHVPLNLTKIQGVFYLLFFGFFLSFVVFLCEIYREKI